MVQSKKVITLIVLTLYGPLLAAESRWTSVRGDGYEIVTDAGGEHAARMANRLEQLQQLLGGSGKVLPLRVMLLGSEKLFGSLRPSATVGGFYQSSADQDWLVVQWGRPDSERALSHEMVHAFMEHSGPRRPLWLEEGLAEFYSTAQMEPKGWIIGRPIENHVRALNQRAWLGEREFFEARPDSAFREEGTRTGQFYAQSWAVVHYLLTTPGVREKAPELFRAMSDGVPFVRACEGALGQRQGLLIENARRAVEQQRFVTARLAATSVPLTAGAPVNLSTEAADSLIVNLALAVDRPALAKQSARSPEQRGLLALINGDRAEAERQFRIAIANGSADSAPYFEFAMLLHEDKREPEREAQLLREAIERNPNHAEAHFLLGRRAAANGDNEGAIDYYQNAARILPRQANFWHALAVSLERAGRMAEASHAAIRCSQAARNPAERQMADGLWRLVREPAAPGPPKKAAVETPESWQGLRGDARFEGVLVEFQCDARPPLARIDGTDRKLSLRVTRPNEIRVIGTGAIKHTLTCGAQQTAVRVEYRSETGELTAIEFR